jgi:hypothetical protein
MSGLHYCACGFPQCLCCNGSEPPELVAVSAQTDLESSDTPVG